MLRAFAQPVRPTLLRPPFYQKGAVFMDAGGSGVGVGDLPFLGGGGFRLLGGGLGRTKGCDRGSAEGG